MQKGSKAVRCFEKACELNPKDDTAYCYLGLCSLAGNGMQKDKDKGLEYLQIASSLGSEEATKILNDRNFWENIDKGVDVALDVLSYIPAVSTFATIAKMAKNGAKKFFS